MEETKILLEGLVFGEGPRWREGRLWFSDMIGGKVMAVDRSGRCEVIVEVPTQPSGLGWLPTGELLIVSMTDRKVLKFSDGRLSVHADLSALASHHCNDMVVDAQGRAYVGNFGFDIVAPTPTPKTADLVLVTPDGKARSVASDLAFPNGSAITPDGRTLIVGETLAARISAFDIEKDGSLTNHRTWAEFDQLAFTWAPGRVSPDGSCLDAEDAMWVTSPSTNETIRVLEGGRITHRITASQRPYACMLGGADRRTLFICTARNHVPEETLKHRSGRIETIEVDVPGAGFP